jgi:16S rRNA (guanine(966)-N(2))-methyltransferase RsmD
MRIIAGRFRSRRLLSVGGADIRPTSDRLRETLFNVLTSGDPARLEGSVWIDLFAGTGAVGIEALSRGAAMVYFVERSRAAVELIRRNLETLGVAGSCHLFERDALAAIPVLEGQEVRPDFIFLDPPYALPRSYQETLSRLADSPLSQKALVVAESEKKFDPGQKFGMLARVRRLDQGDAALSFYRRAS